MIMKIALGENVPFFHSPSVTYLTYKLEAPSIAVVEWEVFIFFSWPMTDLVVNGRNVENHAKT